MPFDPNNPPDKVRGLSEKKQRQWVHVFNSCYGEHHDDEKCHKMAWGVVKGGKSACAGDPLCEDMQEHFEAALEGRTVRIESDDQMIQAFTAACRDIEAADRLALDLLEEVKVKKLKNVFVGFLHKLGDLRDAFGTLVTSVTDAVPNPVALKEFPEFKDILELGRAMRQVRLSPRDIEGRLMNVMTVDA